MEHRLRFEEPHAGLKDSYRRLVSEFVALGEPLIPFPLAFENTDFSAFLGTLSACARGEGLPDGFVPHSTYWLVRDDAEVVGVSNLRHHLTDALRIEGGHIGYGVRPSARRQGFATQLLRHTLARARERGIAEVLLTCSKTNDASIRTILRNGGVLVSEEFLPGRGEIVQRYRIATEAASIQMEPTHWPRARAAGRAANGQTDDTAMSRLLRFNGAVKHEPRIDEWFDRRRPDLGAIARAWFERMRMCGSDVTELLHDGHPTVCVEDAGFGYVNVFTSHVGIGFFQGASLGDPTQILEGTGRFMRHVKARPNALPDTAALQAIVEAAYRDIKARLSTPAFRVNKQTAREL